MKFTKKDLNYWLDYVQVHSPGQWENDDITLMERNWWAVSTNDESIIAYFAYKNDAFRFRLDYINKKLNK